jgi:superfamily I DNA and/or RNA helicase
VILGDEKQLAPTQWFIATEDEEENDEEYADRSLLSDNYSLWQAESLVMGGC